VSGAALLVSGAAMPARVRGPRAVERPVLGDGPTALITMSGLAAVPALAMASAVCEDRSARLRQPLDPFLVEAVPLEDSAGIRPLRPRCPPEPGRRPPQLHRV